MMVMMGAKNLPAFPMLSLFSSHTDLPLEFKGVLDHVSDLEMLLLALTW